MADAQIKVSGLAEFKNALREEGVRLPRELTKAHKIVAAELADDIKGNWPSRSGRSAATIRPVATATSAGVKGGSPDAPYWGVIEFGGELPRFHSESKTHVKPYNGASSRSTPWDEDTSGYFMYPTARGHKARTMNRYEQVVTELADRLFPNP